MGNNKHKVVLIGGGGHCKSVLDAANRMNVFDEIVITDPKMEKGDTILECKVVGTDYELEKLRSRGFDCAFITVGSVGTSLLRKQLADKLIALKFSFPIIVDPSATVSKSAIIGSGTFIGKNVVVNADVNIGAHCIINTGAIIEHECSVGDFSHISVGSILCGKVKVGKNSFIGAGSTVIQCLHIGNNVVIGANSTVLKNVEDSMKYYGIVTSGGY